MININKEEYKTNRKDLLIALKQTEKNKLTNIRVNNGEVAKDISLDEGALKFIEYVLSNHICSFEEIKIALEGKSKYQYISDDINNVYNKQMYMEFIFDGVQYYSYKDFDKEVVIIRMLLVCYAAAVKMNDMSLLAKMQIEYSDKSYMISELLDLSTKVVKEQLIAEWVENERNECSFKDLFKDTVLEKKPCRDTLAAIIEYICTTYFQDSLEILLDSESPVYEIKDEKRRTYYNNIDTSEPILRKGLCDSAPRAVENIKQINMDGTVLYYRMQDVKTVLEKIFDIVFSKQESIFFF